MVTTEEGALRGLEASRPSLLIVAQKLERGSALALEGECFGPSQPLVALSRALAHGQRYCSPSDVAALEAAGVGHRGAAGAGPGRPADRGTVGAQLRNRPQPRQGAGAPGALSGWPPGSAMETKDLDPFGSSASPAPWPKPSATARASGPASPRPFPAQLPATAEPLPGPRPPCFQRPPAQDTGTETLACHGGTDPAGPTPQAA